MKHVILLTGASGMLGSRAAQALCEQGHTVLGADCAPAAFSHANYTHILCDLRAPDEVEAIFAAHRIRRVVHLAALAHVTGETDLSWSRYFRMNVLISQHVFECAAKKNIPVFYAGTVDVYGVQKNVVTEDTPAAPVGSYAKSKHLAEQRLMNIMGKTPWMIARFAPVYSEEDKHDIRKRYYIKYPQLAFVLGGGIDYAFLNISRAVDVICLWAGQERAPKGIVNVTDDVPFNSAKMAEQDRAAGIAKHVIRLPGWIGTFALMLADHCPDMLRLNLYKVLRPMRFSVFGMNAFLYGQKTVAKPHAPAGSGEAETEG